MSVGAAMTPRASGRATRRVLEIETIVLVVRNECRRFETGTGRIETSVETVVVSLRRGSREAFFYMSFRVGVWRELCVHMVCRKDKRKQASTWFLHTLHVGVPSLKLRFKADRQHLFFILMFNLLWDKEGGGVLGE